MKRKIIRSTFFLIVFLALQAKATDLGSLTSQDLVSDNAIECMKAVSKTYKDRTSASPVKLNFYAADNKGETFQNRMAIVNASKAFNYLSIDMEGSSPINWNGKKGCTDSKSVAKYYLLSLHESVKNRPELPIVINFVSNTHVATDIIATGVGSNMAERGLAQVILEYPGYGASLGTTNAKVTIDSGVSAVRFLRNQFPNRKIFLLGHSIGAGFSYEVAARIGEELSGVMIFGGIKSILRQVEDQAGIGPDFISKIILWVLSGEGELLDFEKSIDQIVARNPNLNFAILHGRDDSSVPPAHVDGVSDSIKRTLKDRLPKTAQSNFYVEILDDIGHESVNFMADQESFNQIWSIYTDFVYRLN